MSGRVRHSFKGQGFGRPERNPITDQFQRDHPHVTRYMIQTWLKPNIQAKIDQWKPLYHWNYLAYRLTDCHHLARPSTLGQYSNPRTKPAMLSYAEGCDWLKRSEQLMNLLSRYAEDYIVAGAKWIPIKINNTELRKLFADNIVFISLAGTKGQPVDGRLVRRPSTDERFAFGEDDEIAGFSSSNIFQCKYGVNFEIQFYGDSEVDLLSHVYSHMLHYVRVTQDDVRVACSLHFPLSIDSNCVRELLREELGDIFQAEFCSTQGVQYITPFGPPIPKM